RLLARELTNPSFKLPFSQQKPEDSYELYLIRVEYEQRKQKLMEELHELDVWRFTREVNVNTGKEEEKLISERVMETSSVHQPVLSQQPPVRPETHLPPLKTPPRGNTQERSALSRVPSAMRMPSSSRYLHSDISWKRRIIFTIASLVSHGDGMLTELYLSFCGAQIAEKEQRKQREREEQKKQDMKLEAEEEKYNYWGRGGGAPLKDISGNPITDLKAHLRKTDACKSVARGERRPASPKKESASFSPAPSSVYGRGNVFEEGITPQQRDQDQRHRDFLKLQIEDKKRRQQEEREKERIEEELAERRVAKEREKMKKEYEEELEKRRRKDRELEEARRKHIEQREETRIKEKENRRLAEREEVLKKPEPEKLPKIKETKSITPPPSPPVPALRRKLQNMENSTPSLHCDSTAGKICSEEKEK
ncbi:hypothetical protein DNTS_029009, partial [Danionella cerebrum]